LLMQELKSMNIQMRIITEANVDQLTSLTRSDNIETLTGKDTFEKIEVENQKRLESTQEAPEILKQAAPETVQVPENESTFWTNPLASQGPPGNSFENQFETKTRIPGISNDYGTLIGDTPMMQQNPNQKEKQQEFFKNGDFIKFKVDGADGYIYKITDFDNDYMMWITQAINGPDKDKYRDGDDRDFTRVSDLEIAKIQDSSQQSPEFGPTSPDYAPISPDYAPTSPDYGPTTGTKRENEVITVDTGDMPELDLGEPVVTEKTTIKILGDDTDKNLSVIADVDEKTEEDTNKTENNSQTKNVKTNIL